MQITGILKEKSFNTYTRKDGTEGRENYILIKKDNSDEMLMINYIALSTNKDVEEVNIGDRIKVQVYLMTLKGEDWNITKLNAWDVKLAKPTDVPNMYLEGKIEMIYKERNSYKISINTTTTDGVVKNNVLFIEKNLIGKLDSNDYISFYVKGVSRFFSDKQKWITFISLIKPTVLKKTNNDNLSVNSLPF